MTDSPIFPIHFCQPQYFIHYLNLDGVDDIEMV